MPSSAALSLFGSETITTGLERCVDAGVTDVRIGILGDSDDELVATRRYLEQLLGA